MGAEGLIDVYIHMGESQKIACDGFVKGISFSVETRQTFS